MMYKEEQQAVGTGMRKDSEGAHRDRLRSGAGGGQQGGEGQQRGWRGPLDGVGHARQHRGRRRRQEGRGEHGRGGCRAAAQHRPVLQQRRPLLRQHPAHETCSTVNAAQHTLLHTIACQSQMCSSSRWIPPRSCRSPGKRLLLRALLLVASARSSGRGEVSGRGVEKVDLGTSTTCVQRRVQAVRSMRISAPGVRCLTFSDDGAAGLSRPRCRECCTLRVSFQ